MRITVKGKNMDVSDTLQRYAEKKVEKLEKYFHNLKEAVVTQSVQRNWHIVEVTLEGDGIVLRGEERSDNMYTSIDQVVEKLESRSDGSRASSWGARIRVSRPRSRVAASMVEEPAESAAKTPRIVRKKSFPMGQWFRRKPRR